MKTMKYLGRSGLLFLALLMTWSVPAVAQEVSLEANMMGMRSTDQGFSGLTGRTLSRGPGILAGVELEQVSGLRLLLGYGVDGFTGERFEEDLRVSWGRNRLNLGADYGVDLFNQVLRPLLRVSAGYSWQSLHLTSDDSRYLDWGHGVNVLAAGGLEVSIGKNGSLGRPFLDQFSVGVNVLYGYLWQSPARFDEMESADAPDEPSEEDPWVRATYDAGTMQVSGWTWSVGAVLRYHFGG